MIEAMRERPSEGQFVTSLRAVYAKIYFAHINHSMHEDLRVSINLYFKAFKKID